MNATIPEEMQRLERCTTDLTAILALSASWRGRAIEYVLTSICEALMRMLRLGFVYARVNADAAIAGCEVARVAPRQVSQFRPDDLRAIVAPWLADAGSPFAATEAPPKVGSLWVTSLHFGLRDHRLGTLVTASSRDDYPNELELLRLRVAVNQASLSLQEDARGRLQQRADSQLEAYVVRRTEHLTTTNRQLAELQEALATELGAMARLHEFSTRLLSVSESQYVMDQTLEAIIGLQNADFGNVQLHDAEQGGLVIVAQRNFKPAFLNHLALVRDEDDCASGRAASARTRILIEDVESDESFARYRQVAAEAGFRAVQSTPLISHSGDLLGMISTHFSKPHRPSESSLRLTDLYAHQAALMLERNRAEEERGNLASIVESSSDFIGIASLSGKAFFLNAAARRMIGLRADEPILADVHAYLATEELERLETQILPVVEQDGFWEGEVLLRHHRTGAAIPVLQHVFYIREPHTGRRLALATVCRDISERRRAEQAASKAQQELAHATRVLSMGELTTSIAHEINQPLAAIVANGNACRRWIERAVPDLEQARVSLHSIVRDANRASEVIQRIRAFSTKAAGSRLPLSVNDVIREVLALTSNEMQRERVVVQTRLRDGLPPIVADRVELQQVVLNLVINSIESMRSVTSRARNLVISSGHGDTSTVEVRVCDSGVGRGAQDLSALFEPFFTTKADGLGLGLSISRRIIETHGGQLVATPNAVCGLTLSFTLPAHAEASDG